MLTLLRMGAEEEGEGVRSGERKAHIYIYIKGRVCRKTLRLSMTMTFVIIQKAFPIYHICCTAPR